ncbi:MAG: hypothetical protein PHS93_07910 [Candidatus Omnitrophica bacterium]|nr:hypothetical protein [Candidatus Omnitrophota bacterium]
MKNKIKLGKLFTLIIILIFTTIGIIILFLDSAKEKMEAFTMLVNTMFPYLAIPSTGVAITGIIKRITQKGKDDNKI